MDIGLDTDIAQEAKAAYLETSWQNLARVARLLVVLRRFEEAGIPAVLLKGVVLALRYYRNFGMRSMADIDLLVHPADVRRAAALLADLGWTASGVARSDLLPAKMRVLHAWPFEAAPLHSLDLHWTLNVRSPEVDAMFWAASETFEVESTTVRALSPADQVLHVCTHAVQPTWSPSPRWIVDVIAVLDAPDARVDWARMVDVARRTNATVRLHAALVELMPYASGRVPASVVDGLSSAAAPRWEQRELALFSRIPPFRKLEVCGTGICFDDFGHPIGPGQPGRSSSALSITCDSV
jgi:hypothetical protein